VLCTGSQTNQQGNPFYEQVSLPDRSSMCEKRRTENVSQWLDCGVAGRIFWLRLGRRLVISISIQGLKQGNGALQFRRFRFKFPHHAAALLLITTEAQPQCALSHCELFTTAYPPSDGRPLHLVITLAQQKTTSAAHSKRPPEQTRTPSGRLSCTSPTWPRRRPPFLSTVKDPPDLILLLFPAMLTL